MSESISNGECINWFENPNRVLKLENLRQRHPICSEKGKTNATEGKLYQIKILLRRGYLKLKRDMTLTHLR
jgi:hypothetical protein